MSISVVDHEQPYAMAEVRGRIAERLHGERALEVIDRIAEKTSRIGPATARCGPS